MSSVICTCPFMPYHRGPPASIHVRSRRATATRILECISVYSGTTFKRTPKLYSWRTNRIRAKAALIGCVNAPEQDIAIRASIWNHESEHQKRLLAQRTE